MERGDQQQAGSPRLAELIRARRRQLGLSQEALASASGVKRDYIASIERGRVGVVYPEAFGRLRSVLGLPGWVMLEAMGYSTDATDRRIAPATAAAVSDLTAEQQASLVAFLMTMPRGPEADRRPEPPQGD